MRRGWRVKNFTAEIAEADGHQPDRNVWIELWTHGIGGLSENNFIIAAKIDRLAGDLDI